MVRAPGDRLLRTEEAGDPNGRAVLVLHGMPGAGVFYGPHVADALEKGIRLITYDRPGYGGSTARPGRSVGDCAEDISAIADAFQIDRLAVWGVSGGGPYALASGALLPGRVVAVGTLASPAPYGAPGFDYFAGMEQANIEEIKLMLEDEAAARASLGPEREAMLALQPDQLAERMGSPELAEFLVRGFHAGLAPGGEGWWDDSIAQLRPWGFEVGLMPSMCQCSCGTDGRTRSFPLSTVSGWPKRFRRLMPTSPATTDTQPFFNDTFPNYTAGS